MKLIDYKQFLTVREIDKPGTEEFLSATENGRFPVLIKGAMKNWKALKLWDADFFKRNYGNLPVVASCPNARSEPKEFRFFEYLDYMLNCTDENPYYLRNWQFHLNDQQLRNAYTVPGYFECWTNDLPREQNPNFSWFYIGPKGSFSPLHIDVMNTAAWNAVMRGRKLWMFFPPEQDACLYDGLVNPFYPDYSQYPKFFSARPIICIQKKGDIVYTPTGWWHAALNTQPCISLTENFINQINYREVFSYLERNNMNKELNVLTRLIKEKSETLRPRVKNQQQESGEWKH
jgi:histone arginine demethylase JMJD6